MQRTISITTALLTTLLLIPTPHASAAAANPDPSIASFEGGQINLRGGWGEATACTSDGVTTECFRTEKELDQYLAAEPSQDASRAFGDIVIQSVCSTSLKLYANTSFGGTVLALSTRFAVLNLSTWSFDNITSSYKVGACSATFYDGANAGVPSYPGNTSAGASATSMQSGWDNRVSSVYVS
jgi:hypothetical protein